MLSVLTSLNHIFYRDFPGCGNIVTFAQFAFIALEGFIFEANFGRKKPHIPLRLTIYTIYMPSFAHTRIFILTICFGLSDQISKQWKFIDYYRWMLRWFDRLPLCYICSFIHYKNEMHIYAFLQFLLVERGFIDYYIIIGERWTPCFVTVIGGL